MPSKIDKDYYIKKKVRLMKDFSKYIVSIPKLLKGQYDDAKIYKYIKQMTEEFENLIPQIPYIGGNKNYYTRVLIQMISNLAIFRILEKEGFTYREIGELFYEFVDIHQRIRKEKYEKMGRDMANYPFTSQYVNQVIFIAETSQKRAFPYDWVLEFVEGDGITFEYGFDIIECGVYKIFKELGAEKYVPLQCVNRIREAQIFGYGVFRTQTLATGAPSCDYRYTKTLKTPHKITEEEITHYREKKICLVCKGHIEGFNNYICPKCEVLYCKHCAQSLIDLENTCWVCNAPLDVSVPSKPFERKDDESSLKKNIENAEEK